MQTWKPNVAIGLVLLMVAAACSGTAEVATRTSETGVEASVTTTAPPDATDPESPPTAAGEYPVVMTEGVSGPDIGNITVWAPDADGEWPVVLLLAGWSGIGWHYTLTAERLAGEGVVVFAPDYRSHDIMADWRNTYRDVECAYRHMRTVAGDFGGDLTRPVTVVGHSIGAMVSLGLALDESGFSRDGPFDRCPAEEEVPRPDRVVALSGSYYESGVDESTFSFDPATYGWSHFDADIHLVVGSDDSVCEPWQSQDAMEALVDDGFTNVELTVLEGAGHFDVIFKRWEGDGEWWEEDTEYFDLPDDPGGVGATQTMLDTIMEPGFASPDYYAEVARRYCEAWPDVANLLADDATYAEIPSDGLSIPEGTSFNRGLSEDLTSGSSAVLAALDSTEQTQVECGESMTVSGDWVAVPYTAMGAEGGAQGIWVLRIVGDKVQWHLAYGTAVPDGEELGPINDPTVATEAREFCSIIEGAGYQRSASSFMDAMTETPAVVNLPEGLYWPGAAEVESMVELYPESDVIWCGDEITTSGRWSAEPVTIDSPALDLGQVGMMVHHHLDGKISRQFAHFTRTSGDYWGLPLEN